MTWADRVRDIRADPDSDGPRLVAADWLLERGDIRGEHVVLSCQLAHLTAGTPEHAALERRRRELEGLHSARWLDRIFQLGAQGARLDESPLLKRGFVEAVTLVGEYAASFEAICEHEPIIDLTLVDCGPSNYQQVAAMPALALIRDLRLEGVHIRGCEAVLASPHLTGAERVSLPSQDPALLVALSAGPHRPDSCKLREDLPSLRKLVAADFFARTSNLDISGLTDRGAAVLAEAVIPRRHWLAVDESELTERGFTALARNREPLVAMHRPDRLHVVTLDSPSDESLAEWIEAPVFTDTERMWLGYGVFTPRIAEALERTRHRDELRSVGIWLGEGETATDFTLEGVAITYHQPI